MTYDSKLEICAATFRCRHNTMGLANMSYTSAGNNHGVFR